MNSNDDIRVNLEASFAAAKRKYGLETEGQLRLECLRLAIQANPRDAMELAQQMFEFVVGEARGRTGRA